jgi:hypothetical protein
VVRAGWLKGASVYLLTDLLFVLVNIGYDKHL